jgi:hypothetical protein
VENVVVARNLEGTSIHGVAANLEVTNSIVYFNNNGIQSISGSPTISFSDVQSGASGEGNIDFNPVFAGLGCELADFRILPGSPAIDSGSPNLTSDDSCFPPSLGTTRNDMGAYGGPGACAFVGP